MTDQDNLKPGTRLRSVVCDTELIVVRSPSQPTTVCCGGAPMLPPGISADTTFTIESVDEGTVIGKRYEDEVSGLEVLCTKGGAGALSVGGARLLQKDAKALPASD
ncbi:hypothetical protein [Mycolicibacterium sp. P9-22]|uniref:hypothetical protein n=1 Tax=Mycolicibacterium sp. P9-22 TaxID=2024613 RepID=UPI0011ED9374|nr:hypothetical protein [Mycolicibacterium sp. P9-22]KAA0109982.1 hypothetical protein CIW51_30315 [Mycolicibacterium sp. P9-22]